MIDKKDVFGILSAVEQTAHYTKEYSEYEIEIVHNTIETIRLFVQSYPEQEEFQTPDAPPYKIGDEDYIDRVYCEHDTTKRRITNESNTNGNWQKSVRYI